MNKNTWVSILIAAVVVGGGAFWGGMTYAQRQTASTRAGFAGGAGNFTGRTGGAGRGGASGGGAFGMIIAKDATSITVQLGGPNATSTNGSNTGTKIVLYNDSTQIGKFTTGSTSDLSVGENVSTSGVANSDGSITAQMIQIRPAGTQRPGGQ